MDSKERGIVVTNGAESLVSEVKEKKDQDPIFLDLKVNVHKQRVLDFEQGRDGILKYQSRLCVPRADGLKLRSWRRLIASHIPFIRVPPR